MRMMMRRSKVHGQVSQPSWSVGRESRRTTTTKHETRRQQGRDDCSDGMGVIGMVLCMVQSARVPPGTGAQKCRCVGGDVAEALFAGGCGSTRSPCQGLQGAVSPHRSTFAPHADWIILPVVYFEACATSLTCLSPQHYITGIGELDRWRDLPPRKYKSPSGIFLRHNISIIIYSYLPPKLAYCRVHSTPLVGCAVPVNPRLERIKSSPARVSILLILLRSCFNALVLTPCLCSIRPLQEAPVLMHPAPPSKNVFHHTHLI